MSRNKEEIGRQIEQEWNKKHHGISSGGGAGFWGGAGFCVYVCVCVCVCAGTYTNTCVFLTVYVQVHVSMSVGMCALVGGSRVCDVRMITKNRGYRL